MAARAHDVAAITIKGGSAHLNFPELAHLLPQPASSSPKDIQAAASKAAALSEINASRKAEAEAEPSQADSFVPCSPGSSGSGRSNVDDPFFDLPDLFMDLSYQVDESCYSVPSQHTGYESVDGGLWPEENFLWG